MARLPPEALIQNDPSPASELVLPSPRMAIVAAEFVGEPGEFFEERSHDVLTTDFTDSHRCR